MRLEQLSARLAKLKSRETLAIRIERTGLNQDRKMAMLKQFETIYGKIDPIEKFYERARGNRI